MGLPTWLPGDYIKAAFPSADPNGAVTKAVITWIGERKSLPIFRETRDVAPNKNLWIFDKTTFLNDGNKIWEEGAVA